jgi:hypothetical protein
MSASGNNWQQQSSRRDLFGQGAAAAVTAAAALAGVTVPINALADAKPQEYSLVNERIFDTSKCRSVLQIQRVACSAAAQQSAKVCSMQKLCHFFSNFE